MKNLKDPFKQQTPGISPYEIGIPPATTAVQTTGAEQSTYEETRSRYDELIRINVLEDKVKALETLIKVSSVSVISLNNKEFELRKPIDVSIEQRGLEEFIACLYDAELYGYGESIPEALEDLKETTVNQFKYLKKQEGEIQFGRLPQKQFDFLSSIFVANA